MSARDVIQRLVIEDEQNRLEAITYFALTDEGYVIKGLGGDMGPILDSPDFTLWLMEIAGMSQEDMIKWHEKRIGELKC
jgi:DNA-binding SARP family transcriptional activator